MVFHVIYTRRAETDIAGITAWLEQHFPSAHARWRASMLRVIDLLENDPHRYPEADEATELAIDLRELLHGRRPHVYRVLFSINRDTVTVHRVRHAAQDWLTPDDV